MLANSDPNSVNSIEKPKNVSPVDYTVQMKGTKLQLILPPQIAGGIENQGKGIGYRQNLCS
jgi:hypothetical protein